MSTWRIPNLTVLSLANVDENGFNYIFQNGNFRESEQSSVLSHYIPASDEVAPTYWNQFTDGSFIAGNANCGIKYSNSSIEFWYENSVYNRYELDLDWGEGYRIIYAGINDETQKGTFNILKRYYRFTDSPEQEKIPSYDTSLYAYFYNDATIYKILKKCSVYLAGGAGSGYIGNSLLSNKKMVGYNVPTSSSANTKTESVDIVSYLPETNTPKQGNGLARIRYLYNPIDQYVKLINGCNGEGWDFFWKNQTITFPLGSYTDPKTFSYYLQQNASQPDSIVAHQFIAGENGYTCCHTTKFSLWIVFENGAYKLYFRDYARAVLNVNVNSYDTGVGRYYIGHYEQSGGTFNDVWYSQSEELTYPEGDGVVHHTESTITAMMEWCSKQFRNVNIYINGKLISSAN